MKHWYRISLVWIVYCISLHAPAQTRVTDSLLQFLSKKTKDTAQVNLRIHISNSLFKDNKPTNAMAFGREALALAEQLHDEKGIADACLNLGKCEAGQTHLAEALAFYSRSMTIYANMNNFKGLGDVELGLGNIWDEKGNEEKALEHYINSLKYRESIGDSSGIASSLLGIGNMYVATRQFQNSLTSYLKSYGIFKRLGNKTMVSWLQNNIGNAYFASNNYDKALEYFNESVKLKKELGDSMGLSTTYNDLINVYLVKHDSMAAYHFAQLAYDIRKNSEDAEGRALASNTLAQAFITLHEYKKAQPLLETALKIALDAKMYHFQVTSYECLSQIHAAAGDWKEAYRLRELASTAKDSALNISNRAQINELSARFENEKKDKSIIEKDAKIKEEIAQSRQSSLERNIVLIALLAVAALAFFIFKGYKQKQKAHTEISRQKIIIEMKNKETMDSIHYAQRIQKALFAGDQLLQKNLREHFILYKPKDIVSGDFYWASAQTDRFLLCLADCTGHGVPGAFMSLLNISFLNEATLEKKINSPDLVLNSVRSTIIHALNTDGNADAQDGMDAVFGSFDFKAGKLRYAAANNRFYRIRDGNLYTSETDKMPVGKSPRDQTPFTLHELDIQSGDLIYFLTDGYADQFGGSKGKKFMYKQLEQVLLTYSDRSLTEQKDILNVHFETWRGNLEQIDDVTVIGIRV
ncbi:MAG: tetratricopeptide repeat protein [Bacteroidia bacterium]